MGKENGKKGLSGRLVGNNGSINRFQVLENLKDSVILENVKEKVDSNIKIGESSGSKSLSMDDHLNERVVDYVHSGSQLSREEIDKLSKKIEDREKEENDNKFLLIAESSKTVISRGDNSRGIVINSGKDLALVAPKKCANLNVSLGESEKNMTLLIPENCTSNMEDDVFSDYGDTAKFMVDEGVFDEDTEEQLAFVSEQKFLGN